jgi:hypothetical protein
MRDSRGQSTHGGIIMNTLANTAASESPDERMPVNAQTQTRNVSYTATYSPDDNKLRLYSVSRLPKDIYEHIHAAGFRWAPKQELFVAPMWTPEREDALVELCAEIGDEDQSLTERATTRAERFETYSDKRADEAQTAREAVATIADNIPLGQPILVGHHSERHARKDAERIESGMRKAIRLWDTSTYWTARAAGALRHARYKERPDVRARRIKTIEAEHRKWVRSRDQSASWLDLWQRLATLEQIKTRDGGPTTVMQRALFLSDRDGAAFGTWSELERNQITAEQAQERLIAAHARVIARGSLDHSLRESAGLREGDAWRGWRYRCRSNQTREGGSLRVLGLSPGWLVVHCEGESRDRIRPR